MSRLPRVRVGANLQGKNEKVTHIFVYHIYHLAQAWDVQLEML